MPSSVFLPTPYSRIYWENPAIATTVGTTTWVTNAGGYILPAGKLATNGDRLLLEAHVSYATGAAETKNFKANIGYTSFNTGTGAFTGGQDVVAEATASAGGSTSWWIRCLVTRLGATSASYHYISSWEGQDVTQQAMYTTSSSITWANANPILFTIGNSTGSNTVVMTLQEVSVTFDPTPTL